ncbi:MAG: hypothetical protein KDB52_02660 [Solirubrobacterales bacterium]|nr:hypothetical protein [Solirubrobacterales bacterium]
MLKKFASVMVALVASLAMAASAQAADETVVGTTEVKPISGPLYQSKPVPVNLTIRAEVTTPVSSPKVNPLKNTTTTFPKGVTFNPDNKKTPPCTDAMLSNSSNLADPEGVVAACPKSIVGTGVSAIIIAKINNNPNTVISDPILILFNAGTDSQGRAKIKIYGYSKYTNVGILMHGTVINSVLDVAVPVLSNDSATRFYEFQMPGAPLVRDDLGINVKGLDSGYVEAVCPASGELFTNTKFVLGERTYPGGVDTTPSVTVNSPETVQNCNGQVGKAKLAVKVTGPKSVKSGKKGVFKVTVTNNGTGIAKGVKVTATGGGKGSAGNLNPGAKKTVKVKTKVTGRKGSKKTLTFTAKGGATAKGKIKVKVK